MSKTILVTGTSTGFGKLTTITLAKEGYNVVAAMRDIKGKNAAIAAELDAIPNVDVVDMDVTDTDSVNSAIAETLAKHGKIDVLVNNAGVAGFGLFEATSIENMKSIFEVNVFGPARTYQAVLPSMRAAKSGLIINISSGLGIFSGPFTVPYNMTKFGLEALTEGIRHEIKGYGIETASVLPGPFPTEIGGKNGFGPDKQNIIEGYGEDAQKAFEGFGAAMGAKMEEYKTDAQEVADAVLKLVKMENGTRPYQTAVNRIGEGVEQKFVESRLPQKNAMMENMGWGAY
jgi:NAD(P)-dependent dehydrogenase (short-subunit alcohol dehydrogenase family)